MSKVQPLKRVKRHTRLSRLTLSQQIKVLGTLYFHYSLQKQGHILRMVENECLKCFDYLAVLRFMEYTAKF